MRHLIILAASLTLAAVPATTVRGGFSLGSAAGFNEFILNNATRSGDSLGQIAVGNNAAYTSGFSIGSGINSNAPLVGSYAAVVGGQISGTQLVNGGPGNEIYGSLANGTNVYNNGGGTASMASTGNPLPFSFSTAASTLQADSKLLAGQTANGVATSTGGVLNLNGVLPAGNSNNTVYFNLTSAQLTGATGLAINITDSNGTTPVVIINVNGATDTFTNSYTSMFNGVTENNILYNFYNTTDNVNFNAVNITLNNNPIYGSILTPLGSITASSAGQINGEVIANNFTGNIETHNVDPNSGHYDLFNGSPMTVAAISVPEPAAVVSTLTGLAMAAGFVRHRRRRSA